MIYVTGDIHGEVDISKLNTQNFSQAKEGDYLIICGDFGLIWDIKPSKNEEYWLKWDVYKRQNVTSACQNELVASGRAGVCTPIQDASGIYTGMRLDLY